jgi:DNA-binding response OmpR family regulator
MAQQVLVVDDQPAMVELLTEALLGAGYDVSSAHDGRTGLDLIMLNKPSLVILDLGLPGMSGLEVLRALRNQMETKYLPVIIFTGRGLEGDQLECWMGGADRYLTKPCVMKDLLTAVAEMLERTVTC